MFTGSPQCIDKESVLASIVWENHHPPDITTPQDIVDARLKEFIQHADEKGLKRVSEILHWVRGTSVLWEAGKFLLSICQMLYAKCFHLHLHLIMAAQT